MVGRRNLLEAVGGILIFLPGCSLISGYEIQINWIDVLNWTDSEQEVELVIEESSETVFSGSKRIPPKDSERSSMWRVTDPRMSERGNYTMKLSTDEETIETSGEELITSYEDPDCRELNLTFQLRRDGSVGIFPDRECDNSTQTS